MSEAQYIEGITVIIKVDGRVTLAPIAPESAGMFLGMISSFQAGCPEQTKLVLLPDAVVKCVEDLGDLIRAAVAALQDPNSMH